jgi:hypothetical protein
MAASAGVYFLTSRSQWNDYVLPVYALPGAAGLLGVVCDLLEIADLAPASGAGIAFLVPGGLFELAFPLLLIVRRDRTGTGQPGAYGRIGALVSMVGNPLVGGSLGAASPHRPICPESPPPQRHDSPASGPQRRLTSNRCHGYGIRMH